MSPRPALWFLVLWSVSLPLIAQGFKATPGIESRIDALLKEMTLEEKAGR